MDNIIFDPAAYRFVDSFFIAVSGQRQTVPVGIIQNRLVAQGDLAPVSFMERLQIAAFWLDMKPGFLF